MRFYLVNIALLFVLLMPVAAHSQSQGVSYVEMPKVGALATLCKNQIKPGKFTGNIVRCVNKIVSTGGDRVLSTYVRFFSSIVYYAVILAIMFHGLRMMFGVAKHHGLSIMLVVKLVVVLYFCSASGFVLLKNTRNTLINFPKAMTFALLAEPAPGNLPIVGILYSIPAGIFGAIAPNAGMDIVFDKIDTKICEMLGGGDNQTTGTDATSEAKCVKISNNPERFVGTMAMVAGLFFTGAMGLAITMIVLTYLTAMIFLLGQIIFFFTVIAIAINFLMALAPLALACMLFEPTKEITRKWFNFLISYSIQPIVLAAFLAFLVTIFAQANAESKKIHAKIEAKYLTNSGGSKGTKTTIFDCFGLKQSKSETYIPDSATYVPTNAIDGTTCYNSVRCLSSDLGSSTDTNGGKKACDLTMKGMKLDTDIAASFIGVGLSSSIDVGKLSQKDIRTLLGVKLAMVIFMVIMGSFLKAVPDMVNKMVGGGSSPLGVMNQGFNKLINPEGRSLVEGIGRAGGGLLKSSRGGL